MLFDCHFCDFYFLGRSFLSGSLFFSLMNPRKPTADEYASLMKVFGGVEISSSSDIEARAQGSVRAALGFFAEFGIEFEYEPRVKYVDSFHPLNPSALANVDCGVDFSREQYRLLGAPASALNYAYKFGLEVSLETLMADFDLGYAMLHSFIFPESHDVDIMLWRPIVDNASQFNSTIVHEIWHLYERSSDLMMSSPLIIEGTATFVENLYRFEPLDSTPVDCSFLSRLQYIEVAKLVKEFVGCESDALRRLVDPLIREKINGAYFDRLHHDVVMAQSYIFGCEDMRAADTKIVLEMPQYELFRNSPSISSLLDSFSAAGMNHFVSAVSNQDLSLFYEYHVSLINDS